MPSIGSTLSIAMTGLRVQQQAMNVAAHNIANANTEGYSRQRVVMSGMLPQVTNDGVFGTGVAVVDVAQVRDGLLDANFHRESGVASEHDARSDMLIRMETMLGEPSDTGLSATLDQFFSGWSDLASNPNSFTVRSVVRQRGIELAAKFQELSGNLDQVRQEVEGRLTVAVGRVNELTEELGALNREIVGLEANGDTAGDLRDARTKALDELATLIPVRSTERENGAIGVASSGFNIVDGAFSVPVELGIVAGDMGLQIVGRPGLLPDQGGAVGGLLTVVNSDLPQAQQSLDDLAEALVTEVNALHATGTNADGNTGLDFFDPAFTTASGIAVSADVLADSRSIAAGTADGLGAYRAGASDVAEGMATMRDNAIGALGSNPGEHFRGLVSSIGLAVRSSSDTADVHRTLADRAETRRQSLSGVSIDEELVHMIQFQSAYQAAARVVTAADEMLQSLLAT